MFDIIHEDEYKIYDQLIKYKKTNNIIGPMGYVKLFIKNKMVFEGPNLVIAQGREFVAQKIFNTLDTNDTHEVEDWRYHFISHFGVGSGGSVIVGNDDYTLQGPYICDTHLYRPVSLGNTDYLNEQRPYDEGDGIHRNEYVIKKIDNISLISQTFPSQTFPEGDPVCDQYTRIKCECRINAGEPIGLDPGESIQISEAGLYFTHFDGDNYSNPYMFAHICFAPKFKEKESPLGILWYILC